MGAKQAQKLLIGVCVKRVQQKARGEERLCTKPLQHLKQSPAIQGRAPRPAHNDALIFIALPLQQPQVGRSEGYISSLDFSVTI